MRIDLNRNLKYLLPKQLLRSGQYHRLARPGVANQETTVWFRGKASSLGQLWKGIELTVVYSVDLTARPRSRKRNRGNNQDFP